MFVGMNEDYTSGRFVLSENGVDKMVHLSTVGQRLANTKRRDEYSHRLL
jgi:hypothetical protein